MQNEKKLTVCRLIFEFLPHIGGSVVHTVELAEHIDPYLKKQFIIVPKADVDTTELDRSFPFEVIRVNYFKFGWLHRVKSKYCGWLPLAPLVVFSYGFFALPHILRLNHRHGIDLIHVHGISNLPVAKIAGGILRKPVVLMADGTQESYSKLAGKYESMIVKLFKPKHALVVDNGGPSLPKFQNLLRDKSKITPVYINIDTVRVCPRRKNPDLIEKLGLAGKFIFISIHNLEPIQGVEHSISGFKKLLDEYDLKDAVLLIVGDGLIRYQLEEMTKDLGISSRVVFSGAIDNSFVPEYYSLADVVLATSTKINMNTSTVEAMACGKSVIAFDCGNTNDQLIQDKERGILIEPGDIDDLAKAMFLLYKDPELRQKMGENAREFIVRERSWDKRIVIELMVYQSLFKAT
jgi:glycosyltransferase involved in cell wall biosynthesis